jgi:hypothetical protein
METHCVYCKVGAELSYYYLNDFRKGDGQGMWHTWKELKFMNVLVGNIKKRTT